MPRVALAMGIVDCLTSLGHVQAADSMPADLLLQQLKAVYAKYLVKVSTAL